MVKRYIIIDGAVLTNEIIGNRQQVIDKNLKSLRDELEDLQITRWVIERLNAGEPTYHG